jgi:hypothetical protein
MAPVAATVALKAPAPPAPAALVVNNDVKKVVHAGDTLYGLTAQVLGNGNLYPKVASDNNITNPNLIFPGQVVNFLVDNAGNVTPAPAVTVPAATTPAPAPVHHTAHTGHVNHGGNGTVTAHQGAKGTGGGNAHQGNAGANTSGNVGGHNWDSVAAAESGGQWNLPGGTFDSTGGLQIRDITWAGFGGTAIAPHAYQATKAQQIAVAEKILKAQGPGAWTTVTAGKAHL